MQNLADILFPARDAGFGTVLAQLSEPPIGPHSDNLTSNEDSYPRVTNVLDGMPGGGVYLGVGPDQNFTLIAHARPKLAFIVDYRRRNVLLHLLHKALFSLSDDREAYLSRLTARRPGRLAAGVGAAELVRAFATAPFDRALLNATIREVSEVARPWRVVQNGEWADLATIASKLAGPGMDARFLALKMYPTFGQLIQTGDRKGRPAHFLADESLYQVVRNMQVGDCVLPLTGDFGGNQSLNRIGVWLRQHNLTINVFYISDVEFFLLRSNRFAAYVENLRQLPWAEGAKLVRSSTREIEHPERVPGDSATTIVRSVSAFLDAARNGRIRHVDDLFRPE